MSTPQITIRKDNQATRCEICHQTDLFDPATDQCQRCSQLMLPSVTDLKAVRNIGRERLAIISKWLRISYCGTAGVIILYVVGAFLLTILSRLLKPTQDFINYFAKPFNSLMNFSYYLFLIAVASTALAILVYVIHWSYLKYTGELDKFNSNKQQPGYDYWRSFSYGGIYGFGGGFLLSSLMVLIEAYLWGTIKFYFRLTSGEFYGLITVFSIMGLFFGAMVGLFVGCLKSLWREHRLRELMDTINENGA